MGVYGLFSCVKEQDGAAMSLGNVSSFLDIYIDYELSNGTIDETFCSGTN